MQGGEGGLEDVGIFSVESGWNMEALKDLEGIEGLLDAAGDGEDDFDEDSASDEGWSVEAVGDDGWGVVSIREDGSSSGLALSDDDDDAAEYADELSDDEYGDSEGAGTRGKPAAADPVVFGGRGLGLSLIPI